MGCSPAGLWISPSWNDPLQTALNEKLSSLLAYVRAIQANPSPAKPTSGTLPTHLSCTCASPQQCGGWHLPPPSPRAGPASHASQPPHLGYTRQARLAQLPPPHTRPAPLGPPGPPPTTSLAFRALQAHPMRPGRLVLGPAHHLGVHQHHFELLHRDLLLVALAAAVGGGQLEGGVGQHKVPHLQRRRYAG